MKTKKIKSTIAAFLLTSSACVYAQADQGMNNSSNADAAAACDRNNDCIKAVNRRLTREDPNPYGWLWIVAIEGAFVWYVKRK